MTDIQKVKGNVSNNILKFETNFEKLLPDLKLSYAWIEYYWNLSSDNSAKQLLIGAKIALLETAASWAIGSNRGAAASLRTYSESLCAWIYYKDHHIEYRMVKSHDEDLLLPKAIRTYLSKIDKGFESSYNILYKNSSRSEDNYYSVVSNFIHAHPSHVGENVDVHSIIISSPVDASFSKICTGMDEFISDIFLSTNRIHWDNVPDIVRKNAEDRLGDKVSKFIST